MSVTPTARERQFLRAIAAPSRNAGKRPENQDWWSARDLQHTPLHADFRSTTVLTITALARSCVSRGFADSRRIGTRGHGWTEYRITSFGRGLVADSCIGGGLPWPTSRSWPEPRPVCPACGATMAGLGITGPLPAEIPAHPLPGYLPGTTTPGGNPS